MKTPQGGFDLIFSTAKKPLGAVEIAVKATKKGLYKALQFDRKLKQPTKFCYCPLEHRNHKRSKMVVHHVMVGAVHEVKRAC